MNSRFNHSKCSIAILAAVSLAAVLASPGRAETRVDPKILKGLSWRSIGPAHFSSRATDIAGVAGDPNTIYVAFASAGLFKSTNGGITFRPVFESAGTLSIGAVAVSPKDPEVVYVGTGEGNPRNDISFGDGIYKSTDGGKTWTNCGLRETERFSRIAVSPQRPDTVFAAAMGHAFGPNKERGVFRSKDAGATWIQVLFVNETTGASDVAVDPANPNIIYAGMYDYMRQPWHFRGGGPGSGLYRSSDGGDTWKKLTDPKLANGLPGKKLIGRIGLGICAARPNVVYAMIEAQEPGKLWRSEDRGLHWKMASNDGRLNNRPFYYTALRVDPVDPDRVYAIAGGLSVSTDGGKSWGRVGGYESLFGDHHTLWIDPTNPRRMINGNDGGFFLSNDRGETWSYLNNMPSAQAYHVGVDMAEPYNVMGGFQDHEIWVGPNEKWNEVGVRGGDWRRLRYMADGMYALADPRDPNIIYYNGHFGDITRVDLRNTEERYIQPYPVGPTGTGAYMDLYRFSWNSPIHISPNNPAVVYYAGNVVFKTKDGGTTWEVISPDLTTNDKDKQQLSGGPITLDNTKAEWHCTILSISESPLDAKVLWAGTDDGNVQLTRDGGRTWTNLSPQIQGLPKFSWVASVAASPHSAGTAYIAVDQHRLDDFSPHAFMTTDFGKTWTKISDGLRGYVHVVKEDPKEASLLYAGTELGAFASFDAGQTWTDLRLGLPPISVVDLVVHPRDNDLVIATHARGFYILDDATPLQELARAMKENAALFRPMPPVRYTPASDTSTIGDQVFAAPNKPYGAVISYYIGDTAAGKAAEIEILDRGGKLLRTLEGPAQPGINRAVWDLTEDENPPAKPAAKKAPARPRGEGVKVLPGEYAVRLKAAGRTLDQKFTVRLDPRIKASGADLAEYDKAVRRMVRMMAEMDGALFKIQSADAALAEREKQAADAASKEKIAAARKSLEAVRDKIQSPPQDPDHLNLRGKLTWLLRQVRNCTGRPTKAQSEYIGIFDGQLQSALKELDVILAGKNP